MKLMQDNNAGFLETIRKEFLDTGRDPRYRLPAYMFVMQGLEYCIAKAGEKRHLSGQELSRGIAELANRQFGPLAQDVLAYWGITKTNDFGYIVYNLISIEVMSKTDKDALEDFFGVFDFTEYFSAQECYIIDKNHIRCIQGA
jgi:uncharacterized repeat protein (TIGR04138 family)